LFVEFSDYLFHKNFATDPEPYPLRTPTAIESCRHRPDCPAQRAGDHRRRTEPTFPAPAQNVVFMLSGSVHATLVNSTAVNFLSTLMSSGATVIRTVT